LTQNVKYLVKYYLVFSNHNLNTFVRGIMRPINWFKENTLIKKCRIPLIFSVRMHFGKMSNSKVVRLQAVMLVGYGGKLPEGDREKLLECVMSEGVSGNLPESVGGADLYSLTLAGTNVRALEQTIRITDFNL